MIANNARFTADHCTPLHPHQAGSGPAAAANWGRRGGNSLGSAPENIIMTPFVYRFLDPTRDRNVRIGKWNIPLDQERLRSFEEVSRGHLDTESCRRLKIPIRNYLADILPGVTQLH